MTTPIMPAQAVLILFEDRTPMEHSAHLAPLLATDVHAAEAQIRAEMGFPAALAELYYHTGQSGSHGFQWESFSELGEWCICTRRTQQPHDCGTPARDGRFGGTGLQPSGSDQSSACTDRTRCESRVLSPEIWSHECRKWLVGWWLTGLDKCTPAGRAAAERRIRRIYGYGR